jgi:hypothetical protein
MKYTLPVRMQGGEGAAACRAAAGRVRDVECRFWHKADIPTRSINVRYWG